MWTAKHLAQASCNELTLQKVKILIQPLFQDKEENKVHWGKISFKIPLFSSACNLRNIKVNGPCREKARLADMLCDVVNVPTYTAGWNVWGEWFMAGNQGNHQNFVASFIPTKLWPIFMGMKQKKIFFWKRKSKMADSKKLSFSKLPILKIFMQKLYGLVLGLVGLIDAKGIDVAQPIWSWGSLT